MIKSEKIKMMTEDEMTNMMTEGEITANNPIVA